jgi:prepilin-type N-terminal cleavage/methylation domain-containing protein
VNARPVNNTAAHKRGIAPRGFTMIEAAISSVVLGMLAGAVLTTVSAAAASRQRTSDRSRAGVLAHDLLAEITALEYSEPSMATITLGLDSPESVATNRLQLDDVDDYHGLLESPPRTREGTVIAGVTGWTRETRVQWVSAASPTTVMAAETRVKRITVTIRKGTAGVVLATADGLRTGAWSKSAQSGRTVSVTVKEDSVAPK